MVLRKPPGFVLAVNDPAVNPYIEDAAGALDQLALDAVFCLNCGRQTGGLRQVVSLHAILDADFHTFSPDFLDETRPNRIYVSYRVGADAANPLSRSRVLALAVPPGAVRLHPSCL